MGSALGRMQWGSQGEGPFQGVLVLAGIELIFFLVADTVLCFGFSVRIMLIIR